LSEDARRAPGHIAPRANFGKTTRFVAAWWPPLAAVSSGVLLAFCFPPWNFGGLCWIALTPLICAVWFSDRHAESAGRRARRHAWLGYLSGLVFFAMVFYWLSALGTLFKEPWLFGLPLFLALYLGLYFAFWAWFIGRLVPRTSNAVLPTGPRRLGSAAAVNPFSRSGRNLGLAALAACAWVAHEWVRGWLFSGFGWNSLGVALHEQLALIQIAEWTGVAGISFLVAFANLILVIVIRRIIGELGPVFLTRIRWEFSTAVAFVVAVFAYGVRVLIQPFPNDDVRLRIAAVQPNISQNEKFSADNEDAIFAQLDRLTALAASTQPDLLLWPEAATPRGMFADEINYRFVLRQAARGDYAFLLGTIDADRARDEEYNVAALLTARGQTIQSYRKMHLVPFGEYLPFRKSIPLFAMIAGELVPGDFAAGTEFTVMQIEAPRLSLCALICFEDTIGTLTRRFVQKGAQLLVNLTNDGWFLTTAAAEQHLAMAVFRAIENRRPLVRCANTGVTCGIDRNGRVDRWLKPFERGFVSREVRVARDAPATLYTRWGEWFALLAAAVTLGALPRRRRRRLIP
jgi:apolipoprotein N-acyltransferase